MNYLTKSWAEFDTAELTELRRKMVERQLLPRSITDKRVLEVISNIPRHLFVSEELWHHAYDDCPQAIGFGQTISQPFIVADMTQQLELKATDNVLEVGTGCGYQTAVLAAIAQGVTSIERLGGLSESAQRTLSKLHFDNVTLHIGDGRLGWPGTAPYDAIIVTAAASEEPQKLFEQLAPDGRIVYPFGRKYSPTQELIKCRRTASGLNRQVLYQVRFVPLV